MVEDYITDIQISRGRAVHGAVMAERASATESDGGDDVKGVFRGDQGSGISDEVVTREMRARKDDLVKWCVSDTVVECWLVGV
mmetsp:Transcript_26547/g.36560  ORF Transcript_26547/g.36560 Transcript_26547/m.36560 type:complete len:83 (-) Transcript_26547:3710-3958(-)